jgi:hypothetical protein
VVVVDDRVYVRSVRGDRGYWYQSARERPGEVVLRAGDNAIRVRAVSAADPDSVAKCSAALEAKYGRSGGSFRSMVQPHTLETTLLLEPR